MANFLQKLFGFNDETTISRVGGLPAGRAMARQRAEKQGDTEAVHAIDNGTYKELLEQRAAARESKIAPGIEIYQYSIAGINYRKGIAAYLGRSTGYIKPEPTNRHDPNAVLDPFVLIRRHKIVDFLLPKRIDRFFLVIAKLAYRSSRFRLRHPAHRAKFHILLQMIYRIFCGQRSVITD